jgi:hypothetical protein
MPRGRLCHVYRPEGEHQGEEAGSAVGTRLPRIRLGLV